LVVVVAAAVLTRPATTADSQATYLATARSHARTVVTETLETEKGLAPVIIVDGKDTCLESAQTDVQVALVVVVLAVVAVEEEAVEVESASTAARRGTMPVTVHNPDEREKEVAAVVVRGTAIDADNLDT